MDPTLQDFDAPAGDETLAGTVAGLDQLRSKFKGRDDDWKEWRMLVERAIRIADALEKQVQQLRSDYSKCARADLQTKLITRIEHLEHLRKRRAERLGFMIKWTMGIAALVLGSLLVSYLNHRWHL